MFCLYDLAVPVVLWVASSLMTIVILSALATMEPRQGPLTVLVSLVLVSQLSMALVWIYAKPSTPNRMLCFSVEIHKK